VLPLSGGERSEPTVEELRTMTNEPTARENPLVSAVITTYNRPSYLQNAVESVREQTYEPLELIVVDDHSVPSVRDILDDMDLDRFQRVVYERHDENRGANAARNTGLGVASGEYVAFLDDDDRWLPEKVQRQVGAFDDDVGVVYGGVRAIREDDVRVEIPPPIPGNLTKQLLCRNVVGTLTTVMVRSEVAREVRFDERFPSWADLEWYINLSTQTQFRRLPEPLVEYEFRSHDRLSDDFEKKQVSYERFIEEFDPLAAQYGRLFRRKVHAWAAFRAGSAALFNRRYDRAREFLTRAVVSYPFEPEFFKYFLAAAGGRYTYKLGRKTKQFGLPAAFE
jgi:glycosyltransferase involved in cell wall biosynthesis